VNCVYPLPVYAPTLCSNASRARAARTARTSVQGSTHREETISHACPSRSHSIHTAQPCVPRRGPRGPSPGTPTLRSCELAGVRDAPAHRTPNPCRIDAMGICCRRPPIAAAEPSRVLQPRLPTALAGRHTAEDDSAADPLQRLSHSSVHGNGTRVSGAAGAPSPRPRSSPSALTEGATCRRAWCTGCIPRLLGRGS